MTLEELLTNLFQEIADAIRYVDGSDQVIKTSEFANRIRNLRKDEILWYSPLMTSSNTPSPYVVTASSSWVQTGNLQRPYYAFDGNKATWWGANLEPNCWIQIDFGSNKTINGLRIRERLNLFSQMPNTMTVYGSNDGATWETIVQYSDMQKDQVPGDYNAYMFGVSVSYRYYRLGGMTTTYGSGNLSGAVSIGEIEFSIS